MRDRRRRSQRGTMLIEFSLIIMILMLLALGVVNFALAIQQGLTVSAAAHAGAEYGAVEGNANNTTGMQSAAVSAAPWLSATMTTTSSTWCICSDGSSTIVSCTSFCNLTNPPIQYVQVNTSATIPMLFHFPGLPLTMPLSSSSTLRVR